MARERDLWRALVPVTCLVAGVVFATSARDSNGTELRAPGVISLADTVHRAEQRVHAADAQVNALQAQVTGLTRSTARGDSSVARAEARAAALRGPGGLTAVSGPGLVVTLDDASSVPDGVDANQVVVHQSDLQAVVNALWAGGAEAVSIAEQRVIPTSAVRCVGNTLLLNGNVYSPPFRVAAIGPGRTMQGMLDSSPGVKLYREAASYFGLGYTVESRGGIAVPAYSGPVTVTYAKVLR